MIDALFKLYFAAIGLVIAFSVAVLAYAEISHENLRNAYYANHGLSCGLKLYYYDWGGAAQGNPTKDQVMEVCNFDPDPRF